MNKIQAQAASLADATLHRLAYRLNVVWKKWGPSDYHADCGVSFRNQIFLFADWMLYLFRQGYSNVPEVPNEWLRRNATSFLKLDSEEFVRCIGVSRIHIQAFWMQQHLEQQSGATYADTSLDRKLAGFGRQLDWIYLAHNIPVEWAQESHQLLVDHIDDGDGYVEASKELLGNRLVRTSLGWSEAASPDMWDPWICSADVSSHRQIDADPAEAQRCCHRVFSQF